MFKFGKNTRLHGPYERYREPGTTGKSGRKASLVTSSRTKVEADCGPGGAGAGGFGDPNASGYYSGAQTGAGAGNGTGPQGFPSGGSGGYNVDRFNPVYDFLEEGTILESWIPRDGAGLDMLFRRIALRDPTIGPGIDLISTLPWSDFTLDGIQDKAIRDVYEDCISHMHTQLLMPDITKNFLTIGKDAMSLIFDERKGIFSGVVAHDADFIRVTPLPIYGYDPLVDLKISPAFRNFLMSQDPRMMDAKRALPPDFLHAARSNQGFLPLDPVSTIYLARKASTNDYIGTSLLTRCLYFWAIEKALLNAQMASTRRRSRPFMHLMAGIDGTWEPQADELDALAAMVMNVNEDPVGGVLATRTGVTISEPVGAGQDFYKWSDELELFAKYKMQAIGISDALLAGDATYNNAEQARSVFVESLAGLRSRITQGVFYARMFPTIARLHGFVKRSKAEIEHNIRISRKPAYQTGSHMPIWANTTAVTAARLTQRKAMSIPDSDLIMPTINWSKQLRPNQDEKTIEILERLKQNEYPVTLKQWAAAAGQDPETIEADVRADKELLKRIAALDEEFQASETADEQTGGPAEEGEESNAEADEAVDKLLEEVEKDATSSSYQKSRRIITGQVKRVSDLPIWAGSRCGKLVRTEAIAVLKDMLKIGPEFLADSKEVQSYLNQRLGGEKAQIMAYVVSRLGYAKLPISTQAAQVIARAANQKLNRHSDFKSEKALLDLRRYETEIKLLGAQVDNRNYAKDLQNSLKGFRESLGAKIYSGV